MCIICKKSFKKLIPMDQIVCGCDDLIAIPVVLINLTDLEIHNTFRLKSIPSSLINLTRLTCNLNSRLTSIPDTLIQLRELTISGCRQLTSIPNTLVQLTKLELSYNCGLTSIPDTLIQLRELTISGCSRLTRIPNTLVNLTKLISAFSYIDSIPKECILLEKLFLLNCKHALSLPDTLINLNSMSVVDMDINIPNTEDAFPNLTFLNFNSSSVSIPHTLTNLLSLTITHCFLECTIPVLPALCSLECSYSNITHLPTLPSLSRLKCDECYFLFLTETQRQLAVDNARFKKELYSHMNYIPNPSYENCSYEYEHVNLFNQFGEKERLVMDRFIHLNRTFRREYVARILRCKLRTIIVSLGIKLRSRQIRHKKRNYRYVPTDLCKIISEYL